MVSKKQRIFLEDVGVFETEKVKVFEVEIEPTKEKFESGKSFQARKLFTPTSVLLRGRSKKKLRKNLKVTSLAKVWKIGKIRKLTPKERRTIGLLAG